MIILKNLVNRESITVTPTIFPDGTSQVWKLPLDKWVIVRIHWYFENEAELIHLRQLIQLLKSKQIEIDEVFMPFLPYGRQDKGVSNETTFALNTFMKMLPMKIYWKLLL